MSDIITANYVKFLKGTPGAYGALASKDPNTLYFIVENNKKVGKLYMGDVLVAGNVTEDGESVLDTLGELMDVDTSGAEAKDLLGYDGEKWIPMTVAEALGNSNLIADTQIFEIEIGAGAEHVAAINAKVGDSPLKNGDIAIVKELIYDNKRQYTSYVYDGSWKAMDGNYNANNVYTSEDITVTTAVGELAVDEIVKAGTNMNDLLVSMLSQSKDPTITETPTVSISVTNNGSGASFEAGTSITTKWNSTFKAGSYSYKSTASKDEISPVSETGVVPTSWSIKLGNTEIGTTEDGTAEGVVLGDSNLTYTATVTYSDGNYALTNLNKLPETDVQIKGATITSTGSSISTYRKMYAGAIAKDATINNATIRALLTSSGKKASTSEYEFSAKVGDEKLIFAYPKTLSSKTPKFEYFTMSWEGFDGFAALEETVLVADSRGGENGLAEYYVYSYVPAGPFKADTNYKVSF